MGGLDIFDFEIGVKAEKKIEFNFSCDNVPFTNIWKMSKFSLLIIPAGYSMSSSAIRTNLAMVNHYI